MTTSFPTRGSSDLIAEALGGDEDRAVPLALQQGVGRHRGAHLDRLDSARRQRLALLQPEEAADALHGSILVLLGVLRQQLMADQRAVGLARHDVSERAAAADPELPAGLQLAAVHDSVRHFRKRARFPRGRTITLYRSIE